ncbi:MAG TPA: cyclase family protein [Solirubrobacteraceae bacterium]
MDAAGDDLLDPEAALLAALSGLTVHDASPPIEPGMPMFPAFDGPEITPVLSHDEVGVAANHLSLAEHTGSHVDAPYHFDRDGATVDQLPADLLLMRPYKKFDLTPEDPQPGQELGADALRRAADRAGFALEPGDVAIVEMGWDRHWPEGPGEHTRGYWGQNMPGLDAGACEWLVGEGVRAVASDTAACDNAVRDGELGAACGHVHWFLPRGIVIIEGLRGLARVPATGLLLALPLKIAGGSGSPLRVLLLHRARAAADAVSRRRAGRSRPACR